MEIFKKAKLVAWAVAFDNVEEARRKFIKEYNEEPPLRPTIHRWVQKFLQTGNINERKEGSGRPVTASGDGSFQQIQAVVDDDPLVSTRQISAETNISQSSVSRCLKKHGYHPFKFTLVQDLSEDDFDRRDEFCRWVLNRVENQDDWHKNILFSDEAVFHVNGSVNRHNLHYWSVENKNQIYPKGQDRKSVTIWCFLGPNGVIGYNISQSNMNSERYHGIIQEKVVPYLHQRRSKQLLFQQDGAPPHFALIVRTLLDHSLPGRWIGRRGPIEWPPRSPDLTVCDFFFWGALREKVFSRRPQNIEELTSSIQENILSFPASMFEAAYNSFLNRCRLCVEHNGQQFEQFL